MTHAVVAPQPAASQVCNTPLQPFYQANNVDERFNDRSASVACRQMGLPTPGRVVRQGGSGAGSTGRVWANFFYCTGAELDLEDCYYGFWGRGDGCTPGDAVSIECGYTPPAGELPLAAAGTC